MGFPGGGLEGHDVEFDASGRVGLRRLGSSRGRRVGGRCLSSSRVTAVYAAAEVERYRAHQIERADR